MTGTGVEGTGGDWRVLDGVTTAWFDAGSLVESAELAGRVLELSPEALVDVRAMGLRIRLDSPDHADAVSAAARDLGLTADPSALQQVSVVIESPDPDAVRRFWQPVLGYEPDGDGGLTDPLRRDYAVLIRPSDDPRPLRDRIHLDVVRPAAVVEAVRGEPSGPYGVRHADPDGNEVDLVPGDPLGETDVTADWQTVFATMACYRVASTAQQRDLAAAAAAIADGVGFPLVIDLRPGLVILDSGKDMADDDAHGLDLDFTDLAARLQYAARDLGATADPTLPRFAQLFLDAADVDAVRAFWLAVLGYTPDRRTTSDIRDPRRLNPVLVFQQLDESDTARRQQRNRIHIELAVPAGKAADCVATALDGGGRLLGQSEGRSHVADPEGNESVILAEG